MSGDPWTWTDTFSRADQVPLGDRRRLRPKPKCSECNDTGIVWFDVDTPGTPHYCGGCSGVIGIRHEPACGTEPCPNDCPVVPQRWTGQGATT